MEEEDRDRYSRGRQAANSDMVNINDKIILQNTARKAQEDIRKEKVKNNLFPFVNGDAVDQHR